MSTVLPDLSDAVPEAVASSADGLVHGGHGRRISVPRASQRTAYVGGFQGAGQQLVTDDGGQT